MHREWNWTNLSAVRVFFERRQIVREVCLEATMVALVEGRRHLSQNPDDFRYDTTHSDDTSCERILFCKKREPGRNRRGKQKFWDLGFKLVLY